jgi:hypothetical protein
MILFHDRSGQAIDYSVLRPKGILPAGIAKRITGQVDPSTKRLTTPSSPSNQFMYDDHPATKLEFRTLGFTMDGTDVRGSGWAGDCGCGTRLHFEC